jgi:porin
MKFFSSVRLAVFRGLFGVVGMGVFFLDSLGAGEVAPMAPPPEAEEVTIHEIESSNFDADLSPGEATTNVPAELEEIAVPQPGYLESLGAPSPMRWVVDPLEDLYRRTGLRLGVAHTILFLQPLGGQSSQYGSAGDLDFISAWTLIGRDTPDTGRFIFTTEYRYQVGNQPASLVGRQVGTLVAPTGAFNDRGWVVRDAYWVQRLFGGRLRVLFGRGDPSDYVGAHWLQNVNNSFINRSFSANPSVPFPGHGPLLGVSIRPVDWLYVTAGAANGYSDTTLLGVNSLVDEWDIFTFGEVGWTPTFKGLGEGRYAMGLWHMDARSIGNLPEDWGMTFIADQNLTDNLQVFARYSYADGALTNLRHSAQLGLGYGGLLGRPNDLTGAGFSLNAPVRTSSRNETVVEVFHRFQVTANNQLTVGFQAIANPGNAAEDVPAGMVYLRLRSSF